MSPESPRIEFSVAIATYNRCEIIVETIRHVLEQTYAPREVIIVDDGSSDSTQDVISAIEDPRVKFLKIENTGPGKALKTAIDMCTSNWITICDDDDIWMPNHLERRVKLIEKYPQSNFSFSDFTAFGTGARANYSHFSTVSSNWWSAFSKPDGNRMQLLGRDLLPNFLQENPVFPLTTCFSKELWQASGGIDEKYSRLGCWDAHMTWKLVMHGCVVCDHTITAKRREHSSNFSKKRSQVNMERALMLSAGLADGWIPEQYRQIIADQVVASKSRAARWAWHDHDYHTLGSILTEIPTNMWGKELWKYRLSILFSGAYHQQTTPFKCCIMSSLPILATVLEEIDMEF